MSQRWQVAVIGAGPAGAVAARVLAGNGARVLLVDPVEATAHKVGESLPGAARPLLRHLDLLGVVDAGGHEPSHGNLSAWGSPRLGHTDSIRDPSGPGWHLDRARFDADLRRAAIASGAVRRVARLCTADAMGDGYRLELDDGSRVDADWVIDATGRRAAFARARGARRDRDDQSIAICAWVRARPEDRDARTLVESVRDGWWYTARLPGGTRIAVRFADAPVAAQLRRDRDCWRRDLAATTHVGAVVDASSILADLIATEACGARLDRVAGERWLAAGDAALSFDPLSSQGIFHAIHSGMSAAQAILAIAAGDAAAADRYAARQARIRAVYAQRCRLFYAAETRWRDPFWQARQRAQEEIAQPVDRRHAATAT